VSAGTPWTASFEVLQDGITNLALERITLWPTLFRVIHNKDLFPPIEIVQHQPGHFAAAQPVDGEQREDCACPQYSWT
jgi:hypothetical protein